METKTDKSKTRKLKHVKIYNELYELIQNGTYEPGSQLPSETTLSATMNVSRMTLRKALTLLREDGLIKDVQGVGHFVREPKAAGSRGRKHPQRAGSADSAAVADAEDSASDEMLSSDGSMTHPCLRQLSGRTGQCRTGFPYRAAVKIHFRQLRPLHRRCCHRRPLV